MKFLRTTMLCLCAITTPELATAANYVYINYSPDIRYAANRIDSRIALLPDQGLYAFGHNMGRTDPCAEGANECLVFDFMAVFALPSDVKVGSHFKKGLFEFKIERETEFNLLGAKTGALRVQVLRDGEISNYYYFSRTSGVIAIGVLNFGNREIPESIFFSKTAQGLFATEVPSK